MARRLLLAIAEVAAVAWHEGMPAAWCQEGRCALCAGLPAVLADDSVEAALARTGALRREAGAPCGCGHAASRHIAGHGLCLVRSCRLCLIYRPNFDARTVPSRGTVVGSDPSPGPSGASRHQETV